MKDLNTVFRALAFVLLSFGVALLAMTFKLVVEGHSQAWGVTAMTAVAFLGSIAAQNLSREDRE